MSVYSIEKLITETRRVAAEFRRATGQMLPVSGEISRYDVAYHLNLNLNDQCQAGVDAIGRGEKRGKHIQIKGRVIIDEGKSGHRVGQLNLGGDWDVVILSLMNADFEPYEMYEATREDILDALSKSTGKRSKRGALSVAKFKIIGQLVWTREHGIEDNTQVTLD